MSIDHVRIVLIDQRDPTATYAQLERGLRAAIATNRLREGALMLIPSSAVESMGMGGMLGAAALRQESLADGERKEERP